MGFNKINILIKKYILYIKAKATVSVCVGSACKILPVTARFLWCLSVVTNRPGQPLRGAGRGAISIKEILGENRGTCI